MIAITNEEKYLAKIAGEELTTPEPVLRKEQYLSAIANGEGAIPELPVTREERYLAILAGEDYAIPTPETRLERYMAKACGLDIDTPTPITNVEYYWAIIAEGESWAIITITGTLPLTFKAKGEALTNYLIYGTSEGAGVETENLWDKGCPVYNYSNDYKKYNAANAIELLAGTYRIASDVKVPTLQVFDSNHNQIVPIGNAIETVSQSYCVSWDNYALLGASGSSTSAYIKLKVDATVTLVSPVAGGHWIMLTLGSTAPTVYIPPGYKIPILNTSGVTENLWEQNPTQSEINGVKIEFLSNGIHVSSNGSTGAISAVADIWKNNLSLPISAGNYTFKFWTEGQHTNQSFGLYDSNNSAVFTSNKSEDYATFESSGISYYYGVYLPNGWNGDIILKVMLVPGSTPPDHYIPHRYETNYNLYIGDSKLGEEEYLDYGEQKVYKRTENLWNPQNTDTSKGYHIGYLYSDGRTENLDNWRITEYIEVEPNTNYTLMWTANTSPSATAPSIVEYDSAKVYLRGTAYNAHNIITITTHSDTRYVRFSTKATSWSNNVPRFNKGTSVVDLPYFQPTDPPVPLPEITAYKGENTLSSTETVGKVSVTGKIKEAENE